MRQQWVEGNDLYTSGTFNMGDKRVLICVKTPMDKVAELIEKESPTVGAFGFVKKAARGVAKGAKKVSKAAGAIKLTKVVKHPVIKDAINKALPVVSSAVPGGTVALEAAKTIKDSVAYDAAKVAYDTGRVIKDSYEPETDKKPSRGGLIKRKSGSVFQRAASASASSVLSDEQMSSLLAPRFAVGGLPRFYRQGGKVYRVRSKGKGMHRVKGYMRHNPPKIGELTRVELPAIAGHEATECYVAVLPAIQSATKFEENLKNV